MNPEITPQSIQSEQPIVSLERNVEQTSGESSFEAGMGSNAEHYEQKSESGTFAADVSLTTSLPAPVIDNPKVDEVTTTGNNPTIAKDDDLIEKDWVNKAKKIVSDTRDDPRRRDEAVNKLQVDYLKKRYGKELGVTE